MDRIGALLTGFTAVTLIAAAVWEILNSERFGNKRRPTTVPVRNALMWLILLGGLALSAWGIKHGNALLYGP
jgi:hypothetical protein